MKEERSAKEMPKAYEAKQYEDAIYAAWEKSGFFNPDNGSGEPYTIMMPPPNVTGILHLGHALENTLMDTMARFQRMRGKRVLLVPGTDHAAIATQARVEKTLIQQGMKNPRQELGREKLVEEIRKFAEASKSTILGQIRKMGTSCDWSRLAYTFDEPRNKAVNELFCRMYRDGLIYRGYRVVNWSVKGQSTCSDDEMIYIERDAKMYTFKYSKDFPIAISSTRPETKLGDTAVAVHPSDERYQSFIGKTFTVDVGASKPLEIKIIADVAVDPAFGTGALGVTPAHSAIDFAVYEKQKAKGDPIGIIPVIGNDGKMTAEAGAYVGLSVEDARAKFVAWLREQNLLENEEDIVQSIGTSDRYGDIIEALPMTQWWLDMNKEIPGRGKTLRTMIAEAVTTGLGGDASKRVVITPDRITKELLDRVDNLRDWCLSRQLWWGHRIPVWYRPSVILSASEGSLETFVGTEAPTGEGWEQDPDTLDTWFSAGSWTFSTLGWPKTDGDLKTFHPTNWIQMGYEIKYLWLMRMILMSAYALDDVPFKDAYIHGILRDKHGKKYSKSSDNGFDPIEVIDEYGCDALRVSLLIGISPGNDSRYYTEKIESARNFVNKLWNISRFILSSVEDVGHVDSVQPQTLADKWILSRFVSVASEVTKHLEQFEFSQAGEKLRDFTWNEFADWYLEIAKTQPGDSTNNILLYILQRLLTYWHPFMPFVTETIWSNLNSPLARGGERGVSEMLMTHGWPVPQINIDHASEKTFAHIQDLIVAIRNVRNEYKIDQKQTLSISMKTTARELIESQLELFKRLARVESISFVESAMTDAQVVSVVVGDTVVFVNMNGLVDVEKEQQRISAEIEETKRYLASLEQKLSNVDFTTKAPEQVVATMKENRDQAQKKLLALEQQMQ